MRVWITRAPPGADATANAVRALGFEAVVAPLLEVRPVGEGAIDLTGVGALAFTSANGVRAFVERSPDRGLSVFAVGAATARAAVAAGFSDVRAADGDVATLARAIAEATPIAGLVLHPGAAIVAKDLVGDLARAGVAARALVVYETVPTRVSEAMLAQIPGLDAVLVHSPRAGRRLAEVLREAPAPRLHVLCLSPQVAATIDAAKVGSLSAAPLPNEHALLSLLLEIGLKTTR